MDAPLPPNEQGRSDTPQKFGRFRWWSNSADRRGTWIQGLLSLFFPLALVFAFRWLVLEPFVIPSGSMIPTLQIHDHIIVTKLSYGLKSPFTDKWLWLWHKPERGDVVVFKYPPNPDVFYIKRLIGLPGDKIEIRDGRLRINGVEPVTNLRDVPADNESAFYYYDEVLPDDPRHHQTRYYNKKPDPEIDETVHEVPEGHYFFLGDNRHQSADGRSFGFVDERLIRGKAWAIWLSCDEMLPTASFVCNPSTIRWPRLFRAIE